MKRHRPTPRLEQLVNGWTERVYLEGDEGYWADTVLRACGFLEEHGLRLDEILFHRDGNAITYQSRDLAVLFEYDPGAEPVYLEAAIGVRGRTRDGLMPVDHLLIANDPAIVFPTRPALTRAAVRANIRFWAAGIRRLMDRPGGVLG
jgi:hypothetical protein